MDDLENERASRTFTAGLRLFDGALQLMAGVTLAFLVALPILVWFVPSGPGGVPVRIDAPYSVCWGPGIGRQIPAGVPTTGGPCPVAPGSGTGITVKRGGNTDHFGEPQAQSAQTGILEPTLHDKVSIDSADTDTRVAYAVMSAAVLALVGLALMALHRIARSARTGDPFTKRNVTRLQYAAACVAIVWVVFRIGTVVLNRTLDRTVSDPRMHVTSFGLGMWATVIISLGLLALAEVFRSGCELREFEQATI